MKRILLFVATNVAILLVLSVTLRLLGVDRILDEQGVGLDMGNLLVFSAVLGFSGSLLSLAISKWSAKRSMGVQVIEQARTADEHWLVETVRRHAQAAGIGMPEVGVF
ncbi:MAG: zinc metalloprotease HtpX, partial [Povalibacter sp.]